MCELGYRTLVLCRDCRHSLVNHSTQPLLVHHTATSGDRLLGQLLVYGSQPVAHVTLPSLPLVRLLPPLLLSLLPYLLLGPLNLRPQLQPNILVALRVAEELGVYGGAECGEREVEGRERGEDVVRERRGGGGGGGSGGTEDGRGGGGVREGGE